MTCVFDSLFSKLPEKKGCNNIHQMLKCMRDFAHTNMPHQSIRVNNKALSTKQRIEAREALLSTVIGDGYLMSTFDPLYVYAVHVFGVNIEHRWNTGQQNLVIHYMMPNTSTSPNRKKIVFYSNTTHTR